MDHRRVPVAEGVELHVLTGGLEGAGTPVLLVHGLASNARMWDGVAEYLIDAGHPVASVDQRGHGRSSKPDDGYDFATLAGDLRTLVDHLKWTDGQAPVLAGQSWGGNVVMETAIRQPEATSGLVLVDGGTMQLEERFADWPTCQAAMAPPPLAGTMAVDFEKMIRTHHPDWPEAGIQGTLANVELLEDGTIRPWLSRSNHMIILRHLWEHRPSERYALVPVPVLILPADDPANPRWIAGKRHEVERANAALQMSVTHWIPGDHDLHAQHPEVVAGLIHEAAAGGLFPG